MFATELGVKIVLEAMNLFVGNGYIKYYPLALHVRDSKAAEILGCI